MVRARPSGEKKTHVSIGMKNKTQNYNDTEKIVGKERKKKRSETRSVLKIREQEPTWNRFVFIFIVYVHTRVQPLTYFRKIQYLSPFKGTFAHDFLSF